MIHLAAKALVSQDGEGGAVTDGTKIVSVVPARTHGMIRPIKDGRSTVSDNWQTQLEIRTTRLRRTTCRQKYMHRKAPWAA